MLMLSRSENFHLLPSACSLFVLTSGEKLAFDNIAKSIYFCLLPQVFDMSQHVLTLYQTNWTFNNPEREGF